MGEKATTNGWAGDDATGGWVPGAAVRMLVAGAAPAVVMARGRAVCAPLVPARVALVPVFAVLIAASLPFVVLAALAARRLHVPGDGGPSPV